MGKMGTSQQACLRIPTAPDRKQERRREGKEGEEEERGREEGNRGKRDVGREGKGDSQSSRKLVTCDLGHNRVTSMP